MALGFLYGAGGGGSQPEPESKALIPKMTSNTTPSGIVNQSSYYNGDAAYIGYKAFDGNSSTQWVTAANNLSLNWLSYAFTTPVVVKSATFYGLRYERSAEGTCKLQGSNDGSTWVDISDEIDISTRFDGTINFPNNETAYTNYRLYQNKGAGGVEILELQLYGYKVYPVAPESIISGSTINYTCDSTLVAETDQMGFSYPNRPYIYDIDMTNYDYIEIVSKNTYGNGSRLYYTISGQSETYFEYSSANFQTNRIDVSGITGAHSITLQDNANSSIKIKSMVMNTY